MKETIQRVYLNDLNIIGWCVIYVLCEVGFEQHPGVGYSYHEGVATLNDTWYSYIEYNIVLVTKDKSIRRLPGIYTL